MFAHVMEFIADAQQKVISAFEIAQFPRLEVALVDEFIESGDAETHARHPEGVLIIAEAADAIFKIGLLHENRVAMLEAAAALIREAGGDVAFGIFRQVMLAVGGRKIFVK